MDDVAKELARERLRVELKKAIPRNKLAWVAVRDGVNLEYVSMRYGIPVSQLTYWKQTYEKQEAEKREQQQPHAVRTG
jgi:hypothetical protein